MWSVRRTDDDSEQSCDESGIHDQIDRTEQCKMRGIKQIEEQLEIARSPFATVQHKERHGEPSDGTQNDHIGEKDHSDMVDEHAYTRNKLELIAAQRPRIERTAHRVSG